MKTIGTFLTALFLASAGVLAQTSPGVSSKPSGFDIEPSDSLHIIVDLNKLFVNGDWVDNLLFAANNGEDIYIWTWSPAEHPSTHPYVNGIGSQAWKNSNDSLKMKKVDSLGDLVYVFSMIPTVFYSPDPYDKDNPLDVSKVYDEDIHFLVKPKDGGGYGDPDIKSGDLQLMVDPPPPPKIYPIPTTFFQDGYVEFNYDNNIEEKQSMRDLPPDSAVMIFFVTTELDSGYWPVGLFEIDDQELQPVLLNDDDGDGVFNLAMQPEEFFSGFTQTPDEKLIRVKAIVRKRTITGFNPDDFINDTFIFEVGCD